MTNPEFSHPIKARHLPEAAIILSPNENERAALARRFGINVIKSMEASVALDRDGEAVTGRGKLTASIIQDCAISGEDVPVEIAEDIALRFVPPVAVDPDEELEISFENDDADEIEFEGDSFDLGEAIAQTLGLAIDPFVEGPHADQVRRAKGIVDESAPSGPLAEALKGLKPN